MNLLSLSILSIAVLLVIAKRKQKFNCGSMGLEDMSEKEVASQCPLKFGSFVLTVQRAVDRYHYAGSLFLEQNVFTSTMSIFPEN